MSCCSCWRIGAGLHIGIVYFLWVGIFNLMVIAQFWAFAATCTRRSKASGSSR